MHNRRTLVANILVLAAIGLLVVIYFTPIWWVSLTAPNYPEEAFPDGIRIHFHMNGVFNGCQKIEKVEITEDEAVALALASTKVIAHTGGAVPRKVVARLPNVLSIVV